MCLVAHVDPDAAARRDYEFALQIDTIDAWNSFLKQYPGGFYADLARARLAKLAPTKTAPEPAKAPAEQRANLVPAISAEEQRRRSEAQFFMLKVCNKSDRRASVAAGSTRSS